MNRIPIYQFRILTARVFVAFTLSSIGASLAIVSLTVWSASPALAATTWIVTSTGDDASDTTTFRGALNAAASGDTIDLTGLTGTITLTNGQLFVAANLTINGPGASKLAISGDKSSRVFDIGGGAIVTISGVTIENGNGNISATIPDGFGGGVRNSGTLTLTDCIVSGNSASFGGGGIYNFAGKALTITSCMFSGNSVSLAGTENPAGGAISNDSGGVVTVSDSTFSNNVAVVAGAIYSSGILTLTNSILSGNLAKLNAQAGGGDGGAIINDGSATVSDSTIFGNFSYRIDQSTGAIVSGGLPGSTLTVTNSTITGNSPTGIFNFRALSVVNCTFYNNPGAAIFSYGSANITNSTVFGSTYGIQSQINANITLKNTIIARSSSGNCFASAGGTITSQDHNISDDVTCATFLVQPNDFAPHTDPGLDPDGLKDNGGPTKTIALLPSSVAVDAIHPASDCSVSTDQRGVSRPQGTFCDIGAFEATPDFYLSPISAITVEVGGSGNRNVQINSFLGFSAAVSLTVPGGPNGFSTSFNMNPVTPPSYGSVSSALTVDIGPSVTPGDYSLNVTGTSGALAHSTPLSVTVSATSDGITQVIGTDQALGCIDSSGISNALTNKLAAAQADIDAGKIQEAVNTLKALLNQLNAQAGKHIKTTCTDANGNPFDPVQVLIDDVKALLASLGVNIKADPVMGSLVNSSNAGISGATINIFNSAKKVLAAATTDITGFYYFPATENLTPGYTYTVKATLPRGYKTSTPASQSFTWQAATVKLGNFVLK